jgi:iron complex outermembrane recepter protein
VELDFLGKISTNISLMANYAYTETEITKDFGSTLGNELPNAPKHQAGAWLHYDFSKSLQGLSMGGGFNYSSARFGDANNSYSDGAYTQWDMFAAYSFNLAGSAAIAQLNLTNITDETYYIMRARWTNMPAQPFGAVGSLRVNF